MPDAAPLFTVVVPLYNTERYIEETLRSIQAQTFEDFEVVVVNDASTDAGPAKVQPFIDGDHRFRMVSQENRGLAGARNTGIRAARGRYVALLDADDLWLPRKLELHAAHLDRSPDVGLSYAPSLFIDDNGKKMGIGQFPRLTDVDAAHVLCRNPVGNGSAAIIRRKALDDVAFVVDAPEGPRTCWFDESFRQSEDIELWTRFAATTGWRIEGIAEPLTLYRVNSGGLSADTTKQFATWKRFRDKLARIAPQLTAQYGNRAEAYQHRYLARRSAIGGHGRTALGHLASAFGCWPRIAIEETSTTVQTLVLSLLAALLPQRVFRSLVDRLLAAKAMSRAPRLGATG